MVRAFWLVAVFLGAAQAWEGRHTLNPDGISYLDIAGSYARGDWSAAVNAYWSPMYSWLLALALLVLRPSPYWEFAVAHLVNFFIYLFALGCFHFFLLKFIASRRGAANRPGEADSAPEWVWPALGYCLFLWSSLNLIGLRLPAPDILVAAFVYLAGGIALHIASPSAGWTSFAAFGAVLGLGYLAKAPMFLIAIVFLAVSLFSAADFRQAVPRVLLATLVFALVASPWAIALSLTKGRPTFGDSARLNYAWHVNGLPQYVHWQGAPAGSGTPLHPTRRISTDPVIYEFATPVSGSFPPWYDPSYWYEGAGFHFSLWRQLKAWQINAYIYRLLFKLPENVALLVGLVVLCILGRRWRQYARQLAARANLIVPALAASVMFSMVHVEARYIAAFVVLLWLALYSCVSLPRSEESQKLIAAVAGGVVIVVMAAILLSTAGVVHAGLSDLIRLRDRDGTAHRQWQIADRLGKLGVAPGDEVALIGNFHETYWARPAGVRIIAQWPLEARYRGAFSPADHDLHSRVVETFTHTGAKAIVTRRLAAGSSLNGWQVLGETGYYAYVLPR